MPRTFIGIGSNVDREGNIRSGVRELSGLGTGLSVSTVYESESYGFDGDNFYNLAVGLDTRIPARELNTLLRDIEDKHGRQRDMTRFSPRTLDLDLLLYGDLVTHDGTLDVPRGDILTYAFVLGPLAEIAGGLRHPESGTKIADLWESFDRSGQELWPVEFDPVE